MYIFKIVLTIFALFSISFGHSSIHLDINLVHKKAVDPSFVLKSELHRSIQIEDDQSFDLDLRQYLRFNVRVKKINDAKAGYGPNIMFRLETSIYDLKSGKPELVTTLNKIIEYGETAVIKEKDSEGFPIELNIKPELQ